MQQQQSIHGFFLPGPRHAGKRVKGAIEPEGVRVDGVKGTVPQHLQGVGDAAAGVEKVVLPGKPDFRRLAAAQMVLKLLGKIVGVDDSFGHADAFQAVQHMIDQRLAVHRHQRFGQGVGERPHAGAQSGGQHHGFIRGRAGHGVALAGGGAMRLAAGMWASNQSATGARAGWVMALSSNAQTRGICSR